MKKAKRFSRVVQFYYSFRMMGLVKNNSPLKAYYSLNTQNETYFEMVLGNLAHYRTRPRYFVNEPVYKNSIESI